LDKKRRVKDYDNECTRVCGHKEEKMFCEACTQCDILE